MIYKKMQCRWRVLRILFLAGCLVTNLSFAQDVQKILEAGDRAYFGRGEPQSYETAFERYQLAAQKGAIEALHYIGFMTAKGYGVNPDLNLAVEWFHKAANKGYAPAQYMLGKYYQDGNGVKQSFKSAFEWYERAAKQGYALAQRQLSLMFARGEGVQRNLGWATYYSALASAEGDRLSDQILEQLLPRLPELTTNAEFTTLYAEPSLSSKSSAQVFEGSPLFQLDKFRGDWVVVYSPEAKSVAYLYINDLIPTQATAAGR